MVDFEKLKALGNDLLGKAGDIASKAKEKAGPLAEQAKDVASKGVDITADGIDKATGGKYHDKIESAHTKVGGALGHKDDGADVDTAAEQTKDAVADVSDQAAGKAADAADTAHDTAERAAGKVAEAADEVKPD